MADGNNYQQINEGNYNNSQPQKRKFFGLSRGLWVLIAVVAVLAIWLFSSYNGLVTQEENVNQSWANLQSQYQRRADLIPNLVNTVKGYTTYEKGTLEAVVSARAKATQTTINADGLTEENLQKFQQAQGELSSALSRLMMVVERYPELKASDQFQQLQAQLEGTENRINESRNLYNEVVRNYNIKVRRFPASIPASLFGFQKKAMFQAEAGAEKAPEVQF